MRLSADDVENVPRYPLAINDKEVTRREGYMRDIVFISAAADQMRKQRLDEAARDRSIRNMKKARR